MSQQRVRDSEAVQSQVETVAPAEQPRLRLIGDPSERARRPRVTWTEETVDNENLGRKKSKICCIFHPADESEEAEEELTCSESSESSSDSDSDSGSDSGDIERSGHNCGHRHRRNRPNAYERQPRFSRRS